MMTTDEACGVLGVPPHADRDELRAAFRRRLREQHPDASGDRSPSGQATARHVIEAYRQLCADVTAQDDPRPAARRPSEDESIVQQEWSAPEQRGANARLVQVAVASALVFGAAVSVLFFLVAFSQSG